MESKVEEFQGKYRFLSNFWDAPIRINSILYPTVEHYYQSEKFTDYGQSIQIIDCSTPGQAKRLAKTFPLRSDWDEVKTNVMFIGTLNKFSQHKWLRDGLINTTPMVLEEGNRWHDNFWGMCRCDRCKGLPRFNVLGKLLMMLRDEVFK